MGLWPFGNKDKKKASEPERTETESVAATSGADRADAADASADSLRVDNADADGTTDSTESTADVAGSAPEEGAVAPAQEPAAVPTPAPAPEHDAVNGETGPFDGDSVEIEDFDFTDFSTGVLNLGSMRIALPKDSQVQVEMGEQGPRMLHIVTTRGRITPVAFAAPRSGGQWNESVADIVEQMRGDGLNPSVSEGPWGPEIVASANDNSIRLLGVDGPRWMLRFTLAAPQNYADELADLARDVMARTFVYRGDAPVLAGNALPVALPAQLAEKVQEAMKQRQQEQG